MTAKRFDYTAYDDGTESIYDRKKDKYYFDMQLSEIEELLNELAEENEKLKESVYSWSKSYNRVYEKNERLRKCMNEIYTIARLEEVD